MTVRELAELAHLSPLHIADGDCPVQGAYAGDLLSWVMGRAKEGNAFLTIMTNINVIAVASLAELSCVVFCENVTVDETVLNAAREKGINLLVSEKPVYETCIDLSQHLS